MSEWNQLIERVTHLSKTVHIGLVGKYVELPDAYLSVVEALKHAGYGENTDVKVHWINSETLETEEAADALAAVDGIIVPGGFGDRGIEGKIKAIKYAREHHVPYLGLCLGMQLAIVEFARHVVGLHNAHSTEINPRTPHPVIDVLPEQKNITNVGGTLRLGKYPCMLKNGTKVKTAYQQAEMIEERHRHRYEFNNSYRQQIEDSGLILSGLSPDGRLIETIELADHPYFVASQFHPEFKSRPTRSHPLFKGFIGAALINQENGDS